MIRAPVFLLCVSICFIACSKSESSRSPAPVDTTSTGNPPAKDENADATAADPGEAPTPGTSSGDEPAADGAGEENGGGDTTGEPTDESTGNEGDGTSAGESAERSDPDSGDGFNSFSDEDLEFIKSLVKTGKAPEDCRDEGLAWEIDFSDKKNPAGVCGPSIAKVRCEVDNFTTWYGQNEKSKKSWETFLRDDVDDTYMLYDCAEKDKGYSLFFIKLEKGKSLAWASYWGR